MNRVKNCVFLVRKWSFNIVNIRKMWEKKGKIPRTRSMTKKRSSEIFTQKMGIFPEIGPRKNFLVPPKFGARSPPMARTQVVRRVHTIRARINDFQPHNPTDYNRGDLKVIKHTHT